MNALNPSGPSFTFLAHKQIVALLEIPFLAVTTCDCGAVSVCFARIHERNRNAFSNYLFITIRGAPLCIHWARLAPTSVRVYVVDYEQRYIYSAMTMISFVGLAYPISEEHNFTWCLSIFKRSHTADDKTTNCV